LSAFVVLHIFGAKAFEEFFSFKRRIWPELKDFNKNGQRRWHSGRPLTTGHDIKGSNLTRKRSEGENGGEKR
jgi:hypothetical protein